MQRREIIIIALVNPRADDFFMFWHVFDILELLIGILEQPSEYERLVCQACHVEERVASRVLDLPYFAAEVILLYSFLQQSDDTVMITDTTSLEVV